MRAPSLGLALVLFLTACSGGGQRTAQQPYPAASGAPAPAATPAFTSIAQAPRPVVFRFGLGDELELGVWQEDDLSGTQRVLPDGTISPALVGTVHVVGRTIDETREILRRRYLEYLKDPQVSVKVTAIHSDRIFVLGEVNEAQAVEMKGPTTLLSAIAQADGFNEETAEKKRVQLIRTGPDGRPGLTCIDTCLLLSGRSPDIPLQRGDVVFVPARGVTNWNRSLGQALAPFAVALGAAGSTAAIFSLLSN